jgi:hypothetical protein
MRAMLKTGLVVVALAAVPFATQAGTLEGAVIAGPPGAIVGGVIGGIVGGPNIGHRHRHCWINDYGERRCSWR